MKRLEELKRMQEEYPVGGDQWGNGVGEDDVDWLIEQLEDANKEIADRENSHIELYNRMVEAEDKAHNLEKENERLQKLRSFVDMGMESIEAYTNQIKKENRELREVLSGVKTTLEFYANEENYTYQEKEVKWGESITHFKLSEIEKDWGIRARKLLEGEIV